MPKTDVLGPHMHKKRIKNSIYYYTSLRERGSVKTVYLGKNEKIAREKEKKILGKPDQKASKLTYASIAVVFVFMISIGFMQFTGLLIGPGGDAASVISIGSEEFLPASSMVEISIGNETLNMTLEQFVEMSGIGLEMKEGYFHKEGSDLAGYGYGYGPKGRKHTYPVIEFEYNFSVSGKGKRVGLPAEITQNITINETDEMNVTVNKTINLTYEVVNETTNETYNVTEENVIQVNETVNITIERAIFSSMPNHSYSAQSVLKYSEILKGNVSKIRNYALNITNITNKTGNYSAELIPNSVRPGNLTLFGDAVNLRIENGTIIATTDYQETEEGYGEGFESNLTVNITLGLADLGISIPEEPGTYEMIIRIEYNNTTIIEQIEEIIIENVTEDVAVIDSDKDGDPDATDCEPEDKKIYTGAKEKCNGIDDNCDGAIDEGCKNETKEKNEKIGKLKKYDNVDENVKEDITSKNVTMLLITLKEASSPIQADGNIIEGSRVGRIISVTTNLDGLLKLAEDPNIDKIYMNQPVSLLTTESVNLTRIDDVHALGLNGSGIKICVLDTGVDESVVNNYAYGYDFVNDDYEPWDDNGHGTRVGSIIDTVVPASWLIAVKVMDSSGQGYESDVLEGLEYCENENVDIISLSIGAGSYSGFCDSNPVAEYVNELVDKGIVVVAATGNDGSSAIKSPSCASNATRVSSTDKSDAIADFANVNYFTDLFAPGKDIQTRGMGGMYETDSGTSLSVPFVSGTAALILENESLTPSGMKYRLMSTGEPVEYVVNSSLTINISRIDAWNAVFNIKTMDPYNYQGGVPQEEPAENETYEILSWWDTSFPKCRNITIENAGTSELTNFPVYINLSYDYNMQSDFEDIRFVGTYCNNGGTELDHEVEYYVPLERAEVWVKVPSIPAGGTNISVYYGNPNAGYGGDMTGVWSNGYVMVQHLNETSGTHKDSTSNNHDCSSTGSTQDYPGYVDGANDFSGSYSSGPYLDCGRTGLEITGNMTVEAWVNADTGPAGEGRTVASMYQYSGGERGWNFGATWTATGFTFAVWDSGGSVATAVVPGFFVGELNEWHYMAGTYYPSTHVKMYMDGEINNTDSSSVISAISYASDNFMVARRSAEYQSEYDGTIDELRYSNVVRSADWINQTYHVIANNDEFVKVGSEIGYGDWWNDSFIKCKDITITSPVDSLLTDFPVYVKVDYDSNMQSDFDDIRFVNEGCGSGGSLMVYELDNYTAGSEANFWVKLTLPPTVVTLSMYYGNDDSESVLENPENVWDDYYEGVYHMEEKYGKMMDSTSDQADLTDIADPESNREYAGIVGTGTYFDDSDVYHLTGWDADDTNGVDHSYCAWIKTTTSNGDTILEEGGTTAGDGLGIDSGALFFGESTSTTRATSDGVSNDGEWHYVCGVYNSSSYLTLFIDGELNASAYDADCYVGTNDAGIGGMNGANGAWDDSSWRNLTGTMDEVRVSNNERSADWINATYQLIANQGTFVSFGGEEYQDVVYLISPDDGDSGYREGTIIPFKCAASLGGTLANVSLYGDFTGSWGLNQTNSSPDSSGVVSFDLDLEGDSYIWNCKACNSSTCIWSSENRTSFIHDFLWWNNMYSKCKDIVLSGADQENFPLYINLQYDSDMQNDFGDVRFVDQRCNNRGLPLDYELENYTAGDEAHFWVRVPDVSARTISVYYGNWDADYESNATGVWDDDFVMVQHMNETGTGNRIDSTSYGNDADPEGYDGDEAITGGTIDGADDFTTNDYLTANGVSGDVGTGSLTMEAWLNTSTSTDDCFLNFNTNVYGNVHVFCVWAGTGSGGLNLNDGSNYEGIRPVNDGNWHHVAATMENSNSDVYYYVDGIGIYSHDTAARTSSTNLFTIAAEWDAGPSVGNFLEGELDEIRISKTARSPDWLMQTYGMVKEPDYYFGYGKEKTPESSGWWNLSFSKCKEITISNAGDTGLMNFPAYIDLSYDSDMQNDFDDVRFVGAPCGDGGDILDYEIEDYTASTEADVWVRIPSLPADGVTISMYYGNSSVDSEENETGVWDSSFVMVQHLNETSGTHYDSTSNDNDGTSVSTTQDAEGKVDGANNFTGDTSYVDCGDDSTLDVVGDISIEGWFNADTFTGKDYFGLISKRDTYAGLDWEFYHDTFNAEPDELRFTWRDASGAYIMFDGQGSSISTGSWHHIAVTRAGSTWTLYIDGASDATESQSGAILTGDNITIGSLGADAHSYDFDGSIDEIRISKSSRSADWINQTYQMVENQGDYVSYTREYAQGEVWWNTTFLRCRNIYLKNGVGETLTDFPYYINIASDPDMLSNYDDIRFVDTYCNSGGEELDYEIDNYTSASAHVWVKIPELSTAGNVISVYYKNGSAVNSGENPSGVWDDYYRSVYHAEHTSGNLTDSTGFMDGVEVFNPDSNMDVEGIIGRGDYFDGDDYITVTDWDADGVNGNDRAYCTWIKYTTTDDDIILEDGGLTAGDGLGITDGYLRYGEGSTPTAVDTEVRYNDGEWHYFCGVYNSSDYMVVYVDGDFYSATYDDAVTVGTDDAGIGKQNTGGSNGVFDDSNGHSLTGTLDEIRISTNERSAGWIKQTYLMITNRDTYVTILEEEVKSGVTLMSPADGSEQQEGPITFSCSASLSGTLANISLYGNYTGEWSLKYTNSSVSNGDSISHEMDLSDGFYTWNCKACDTLGSCTWANDNFTLNLTDKNWWDGSYKYRVYFNVTNNVAKDLYYWPINISLNTTNLISEGKLRSDCADIRILQGNNTLPWSNGTSCNSDDTRIWFRVNLTASATTDLYVYYGYSGATDPGYDEQCYKYDGNICYLFYDDFSDNECSDWAYSEIAPTCSAGVLKSNQPNNDNGWYYFPQDFKGDDINFSYKVTYNNYYGMSGVFDRINETDHWRVRHGHDAPTFDLTQYVGGTGYVRYDGSWSGWTGPSSESIRVTVLRYGSNIKVYEDTTQRISYSSASTAPLKAEIGFYPENVPSYDDITLRPYATTLPSREMGEEEEATGLNLGNPQEGAYEQVGVVTFSCTPSISGTLANVSLYGNYTGTWGLNQTNSSSDMDETVFFNVTLGKNDYIWDCKACDTLGSCIYSGTNRTLHVRYVIELDLNASSIDGDETVKAYGLVTYEGDTYSDKMVNLWNNNTEITNSSIFGTGNDGDLVVTGSTTINDYAKLVENASSGDTTIEVDKEFYFDEGDEFLIIQTKGKDSGKYEFRYVESTDSEANTITFSPGLTNTYYTGGTGKTQVVRVPNYMNVTIQSGGKIEPTDWSMLTEVGGIIAFRSHTLHVMSGGYINATGAGYWGATHALYEGGVTDRWGGSGEGYASEKNQSNPFSESGAGAGGFIDGGNDANTATGSGGGGGYGTSGIPGVTWPLFYPYRRGMGGTEYGTADLSEMFFGGGGGGGGHDNDAAGRWGGGGGYGGGIIFISAYNLTVQGKIECNGTSGKPGTDGHEGGGGAGGSIYLKSYYATLGSDRVTSKGGKGDTSTTNGTGGDGRIRVEHVELSGTTNPSASTLDYGSLSVVVTNSTGEYNHSFVPGPGRGTLPIKANVTLSNTEYYDTENIVVYGIEMEGPVDNDGQSSKETRETDFYCKAYGRGTLANVSLYGNFTGSWARNTTNSSASNDDLVTFKLNLSDSYYNWNCQMCNTTGSCEFSGSNRTIRIQDYTVTEGLSTSTTTPSTNITITGTSSLGNGTDTADRRVHYYIDDEELNYTYKENWWNSSWPYRSEINVESMVSSTLTDFLTLVNFSTAGMMSSGDMRTDCGDVRFTDTSGKELNYTIEASTCGTSNTIFWVWIDSLAGNDNTTLYMYYGNPDGTTPTDHTNPDADMDMVYHFDNSTVYNEYQDYVYDFSGNGDPGYVALNATYTTGKFGGAFEFNGGDEVWGESQFISLGKTALTTIAFPYSFSVWAKGNFSVYSDTNIYCGVHFSRTGGTLAVGHGSLCPSSGAGGSSSGRNQYQNSTLGVPDGEWHHYVGVVTSYDDMELYMDGVEITGTDYGDSTTISYKSTPGGEEGRINSIQVGYAFNYEEGAVDELRVYNAALSTDEILAIYNSTKVHVYDPYYTDSNGFYNFTFTAPASTGSYTIKVNMTYGSNTYIGENETTLDVGCVSADDCSGNQICINSECYSDCTGFPGYGCSNSSDAYNSKNAGTCLSDGTCDESDPVRMDCQGATCTVGTDNTYDTCTTTSGDACMSDVGADFTQDGTCASGATNNCDTSGEIAYDGSTTFYNACAAGRECDTSVTGGDYSRDGYCAQTTCCDATTNYEIVSGEYGSNWGASATFTDGDDETCDCQSGDAGEVCDSTPEDDTPGSDTTSAGVCRDGTCDTSMVSLYCGATCGTGDFSDANFGPSCDGATYDGWSCDANLNTFNGYDPDGICLTGANTCDNDGTTCYNGSHYIDDCSSCGYTVADNDGCDSTVGVGDYVADGMCVSGNICDTNEVCSGTGTSGTLYNGCSNAGCGKSVTNNDACDSNGGTSYGANGMCVYADNPKTTYECDTTSEVCSDSGTTGDLMNSCTLCGQTTTNDDSCDSNGGTSYSPNGLCVSGGTCDTGEICAGTSAGATIYNGCTSASCDAAGEYYCMTDVDNNGAGWTSSGICTGAAGVEVCDDSGHACFDDSRFQAACGTCYSTGSDWDACDTNIADGDYSANGICVSGGTCDGTTHACYDDSAYQAACGTCYSTGSDW
ncbi:MAG: DUF2341 domain-containing protein, partial [Candidatus Aenigmarchaeota archaeon]|nr:DUF2341 domain-containing protein [Candidatus Aenigmarchaeota archaeon]